MRPIYQITGRGAQSKRPFSYELSFHEQAAHFKAVHQSGIPTAYAIFESTAFAQFLLAASKLTPESGPVAITGRRSTRGNMVALVATAPDASLIRLALKDVSGKSVNSTNLARSDWNDWLKDVLRQGASRQIA